jgi:hypothetical protein
MEFKHHDQLRRLADIHVATPPAMTRRERLERWAEILAREPQRRLKTLDEIDLKPEAERAAMRADDSPLALAYADPVLRAQGLEGDRLGDAMKFFDLSEYDAHWVLCSCLNGRTMESGRAAQRVRMVNDGSRSYVRVGAVAFVLAVPVLLYFF